MSNFLSHLAAKNLNLAPVIQPRPLSRFEPATPRTAPGLGLRFANEALDISDSVEPDAPRALLTARRPALIDPQVPVAEPSVRQAPSTLQSRIKPPLAAPLPFEQRRDVQREIINVTNIRSLTVTEKDSLLPERTVSPIGIEIAAHPTTDEEHVTTPHPIVTPVIERIIHERERALQSQVQPRSEQVAHGILPPLADQQPEIEPPKIYVTIGRIEVRATPPAAPVKRATPASSALSLDDYLRARDGGQR